MANTLVPQVWTPGSDYTLGVSESQVVFTRDGNDNIISYNPGVDNDEERKLDIWIGDREVPLLDNQQPVSDLDWQNRFILGDWQQPYYIDSQSSNFGLNEFVAILDLDPNRDLIQLHGTEQNYSLEEVNLRGRELGTAIFWQEGTNSDLVAFLPSVTDLDWGNDLFQFQGNNPPPSFFTTEGRQLGTPGIDLSTSSATDLAGNIYLAGATNGSLEGSNAGSYDPIVTKYDSDGNEIWNLQFGSTNFDWITDLVTDNQNNFYVAGYTEGSLEGSKEAEVSDVWLAKYDSDGNQIWSQQFGTAITNRTFALDVDNNRNVYLAGYTIEENRNSQTDDSWVTKYDSNGNREWFSEFGTPQFDEAYDVAVDNQGNVYSTGWTFGDLGANNAGLYDVWLAKHNNNGELQFIEQFGSEDYEFPWGLDTDSQGNVYVTGWTLGDLAGNNAGSYDVWLAKYSPEGDRQWSRQFGTPGDDSLLFGDLEVDSNGDIFLTGHTNGNLGNNNAGFDDVWVAKYSSNGDRQWLEQFGTSALDYAHDLSRDNAGNLYVTGITEGSWGGTNGGAADGWMAKLDSNSGNLENFTGSPESMTVFPPSNSVSNFSSESSLENALLDDPERARSFIREIGSAIGQTISDFADSNNVLAFEFAEVLTNLPGVINFTESQSL